MKQRNNRYTLAQMEHGDRFYFATDRKRRVYQLRDYEPFEQLKVNGYWKRFAHCRPDGSTTSERHLSNVYVIFLRNINT